MAGEYVGSFELANGQNIAVIYGVTDGSVDTALATLPPNPFPHTRVMVIPVGEGVYVENTTTNGPLFSGITTTTIDVRSSAAAKAFKVIVIALGAGTSLTRDHSAVTT
jgi:hypothetical protein